MCSAKHRICRVSPQVWRLILSATLRRRPSASNCTIWPSMGSRPTSSEVQRVPKVRKVLTSRCATSALQRVRQWTRVRMERRSSYTQFKWTRHQTEHVYCTSIVRKSKGRVSTCYCVRKATRTSLISTFLSISLVTEPLAKWCLASIVLRRSNSLWKSSDYSRRAQDWTKESHEKSSCKHAVKTVQMLCASKSSSNVTTCRWLWWSTWQEVTSNSTWRGRTSSLSPLRWPAQ